MKPLVLSEPWAKAEKRLLERVDVSAGAKQFYLWIKVRCGIKGFCYWLQSSIARLFEKSTRTVKRWVEECARAGLLLVTHRGSKSSLYSLPGALPEQAKLPLQAAQDTAPRGDKNVTDEVPDLSLRTELVLISEIELPEVECLQKNSSSSVEACVDRKPPAEKRDDDEVCIQCGGTGWKIIERGGLSGAVRCGCLPPIPRLEKHVPRDTEPPETTVARWLRVYTQVAGKDLGEPDRFIVREVVQAMNGVGLGRLNLLLHDLHYRNVAPGKSYGWFVSVVRKAFAA